MEKEIDNCLLQPLAVCQTLEVINITSQPQDQLDVFPGEDVTFSVDVSFSLPPANMFYEWHFIKEDRTESDLLSDGSIFSGVSTDTLTVFSVNDSRVGWYFVKVSAVIVSGGVHFVEVESDSARLTLGKLSF